MAVADSHGLPVGLCIESASPHEVKLVDSTLVEMVIPEAPRNLVGDNAYDSDKLDAELKPYGIEVIAPHRNNSEEQDSRRTAPATLPQTLENREAVCLASELPTACCPLRASCRKLSGYVTPRLLPNPVEAFMRCVLAP